MKIIQLFFLLISLSLPSFAFAAEHAEHKHDSATHAQLKLNNGKKWNSDEALRQAMSNIHASVTSALPAIHAGKLKSTQYDALGKEIQGQLVFIVRNCKLDPKADEQLHLILGGITGGINMATAKQNTQKRAQGIHAIAESINAYGKYFDHPDWQMIALTSH